MPSNSLPWKVRAVQMDLARRHEPLDTIFRFIDFAAGEDFNTLVLYLEARVRTKSFPWGDPEQSYTAEEMGRVVEHAQRRGMEVVPVVPTLGHCEQFLCRPEMASLAEEREGAGRFGAGGASTFCPSLPAVYEFLEQYLSEIAAIFPSSNLHIGLDEAWNLGYCELCRERWKADGLGSLFTTHLLRLHQICRSLGKRAWIWDDLYEFFPEELEKAPRDIVLCHWNYDSVIETRGVRAHFLNRARRDWLGVYDRLGFEVLVCPWGINARNIETITDYGRRYPVLGGLLTLWEPAGQRYEAWYPSVRFAGRLWRGAGFDPEEAWQGSSEAIRAISQWNGHTPSGSLETYLYGPLEEMEIPRRDLIAIVRRDLAAEEAGAGGVDAQTARANRLRAEWEMLYWRLRELMPRIFDPGRPDGDAARLQRDLSQVRAAADKLGRDDETHGRSGLASIGALLDKAQARLESPFTDSDWRLVLRLFLPDFHGMPRLKAKAAGGALTEVVVDRVVKPLSETGGSHYTIQVPFRLDAPPESVTIEISGYGGQGIMYLETQNRSSVRIPDQVEVLDGIVRDPKALLTDDSHVTHLADPHIASVFLQPASPVSKASVRVTLRRDEREWPSSNRAF